MLPPSENQSAVAKNVQSTSKTTIYTNTNSVYLSSKRLLDFLAAFIGIILLSPFLLLTAICIKVEDSKGPVLFKQERVGKNGKTFFMYKFRSMVSNAEELKKQLLAHNEVDGPVFKIKEDPRVTKVGKFIRRTSIDELPQLINVLKGEMSLVGPRPALPEEVDQYTIYERQRLKVLPGLTCYWQVSGRSNVSFYEWMELDIKYICECNFWLDLKLIFKTVLVLFGSKDAY